MPQAAIGLINDFQVKISGLAKMPLRYRVVEVSQLRSKGVRRMNVGKYSVYFSADETSLEVYVLGVLYGAPSDERLQNLLGILDER